MAPQPSRKRLGYRNSMRITWLISSAVTQVDGQWYSPLASLRYRVLAPARYLESRGHRNQFLRLDQKLNSDELAHALAADVVVVSKVLAQGSVEIARKAHALGARIIVDLCDDHFDTRLNSSHLVISYAVFCLKKKNDIKKNTLGRVGTRRSQRR